MSKEILLDAPNVGAREKKYLNEAIDSGYVSTAGPLVEKFEKSCAGYLGAAKAVSTQSGTTALHLALYELGVGKGDEVIVPALTFVATVNPVVYVGANPVFADVDRTTWNIDPASVESHMTQRTKAIIPVHLYGNPSAMDEIKEIARRHNVYVIEDATESLGARYHGAHTGTIGDFGCFSFNGNKIITTGGGGMVVGKDPDKLDHIRFLVNQARDASKGYYHPEIGFNDRMTNIEAALGLAQLERLEEFLAKKKRFQKIYRDYLGGRTEVTFQECYKDCRSSYWLTCITLDGGQDPGTVAARAAEKGVRVRRVFMPIVEFPPYKKCKKGECANAYAIYHHGLCLPASTCNEEEDIRRAAEILREAMTHA